MGRPAAEQLLRSWQLAALYNGGRSDGTDMDGSKGPAAVQLAAWSNDDKLLGDDKCVMM